MSNSTKLANPMKVITGKDTRWSYANCLLYTSNIFFELCVSGYDPYHCLSI